MRVWGVLYRVWAVCRTSQSSLRSAGARLKLVWEVRRTAQIVWANGKTVYSQNIPSVLFSLFLYVSLYSLHYVSQNVNQWWNRWFFVQIKKTTTAPLEKLSDDKLYLSTDSIVAIIVGDLFGVVFISLTIAYICKKYAEIRIFFFDFIITNHIFFIFQ